MDRGACTAIDGALFHLTCETVLHNIVRCPIWGLVCCHCYKLATPLWRLQVCVNRELACLVHQDESSAFMQGMFQYFFYTRVLTAMTAPITDKMGHIASSPVKTFIDQALHHPFLYFPCFYGVKYVGVQGEKPEVAYQKYCEELWPNCKALWTIWVPGQVWPWEGTVGCSCRADCCDSVPRTFEHHVRKSQYVLANQFMSFFVAFFAPASWNASACNLIRLPACLLNCLCHVDAAVCMQLLNFAIMPAHLQIPTAAGISFGWTVILSMMRGATTQKHTEELDPAEHGSVVRLACCSRTMLSSPCECSGGESSSDGGASLTFEQQRHAWSRQHASQ